MATDPSRGDVYDEVRIIRPTDADDFAGGAAGGAEPGRGSGAVERRTSRVDDASALDDAAAIDPRELDAMVRIDEGATVDEDAPVAGVRYEGEEPTPHRYGQPDDAYGPGHGDGRIGLDKVVGDVAREGGAAEA